MNARVVFALRQAAVVAATLVVVGLVVAASRPSAIAERGSETTVFWWAALAWAALIVVHAAVSDLSLGSLMGREPLWLAVLIAAATLIVGVANAAGTSVGAQVVWLGAQAIGWVSFWWAIVGLVAVLAAIGRH